LNISFPIGVARLYLELEENQTNRMPNQQKTTLDDHDPLANEILGVLEGGRRAGVAGE
jgi:hypothetical protein